MGQTSTESAHQASAVLDCSTQQEKENLDRVLSLYQEVITGRRIDRVDEYFDADFTQHDQLFGAGREGFKEFIGGFFHETFADLSVSTEIAIAQNDRVMAFTTWRGSRDGRELELPIADLYRVRDGRFVEHWDLVGYPELEPYGVARPEQVQPDTPIDRTGTEAQLRNLELLERYTSEITVQDTSRAHLYIVEDFIQHDPMIYPGLDGFRQCCEIFKTLCPDMEVSPHHLIAGTDHVGAIWDWNGHQVGTGNDFVLPGADVYRIKDKMLTEHWDVMDYTDVIATLGFHPKTVFMR